MDLVRELKEVRFELSLRGYDCEAVDAFLAKLRSDVAAVQQESDAASSRIAELESQVQEGTGGASSETEGTLRRTLVLAQRLADETEIEAKQAAAELVDAATAEANDLRKSAEADATSMRESGESELSAARDEAASIRDVTSEEAAKARAESRQTVAGILEEAESRGAERVVVIEQAAQEQATAMREPIRAEVLELEDVRGRLLTDIAELEAHLEQQRVRVKTAVEALRVGMSGSIEDLERVADDDELLATQPAPEHSGASGTDVAAAPPVEIVDRVDGAVPDAPTVDGVEADAIAKLEPITDEATSGDDVIADEPSADEPVVDEPDTDESAGEEPVAIDATPTMVEVDPGPSTERIPIVETVDAVEVDPVDAVGAVDAEVVDEAILVEADEVSQGIDVSEGVDEAELIDFDTEPSGMFGTEVGEDAEASTAPVAAAAAATAVGGAAIASSVVDGDDDSDSPDGTTPASGPGFVDRFAESLDTLPVARS